jgi:hypothetical protein
LNSELVERVSELRRRGRTPKEIARALGPKPADVMPVIRAIGAQAPRRKMPVAGCWVTEHWADGLDVTGHSELPSRHRWNWRGTSSDVTFGQDGKPYPCELRSSLMASPVAAATICRASRCVALACQRENSFTPGIDSQ